MQAVAQQLGMSAEWNPAKVAKPVTAGETNCKRICRGTRRRSFSDTSLNRFLLATVSGTKKVGTGHRAEQRQIDEKRQPQRRRGQLGQRAADQGTGGGAEEIRGCGNARRASGAAVDIGFGDPCGGGAGCQARRKSAERPRRE